jgi:TRAP transporter 4TM/12TM fusion protein
MISEKERKAVKLLIGILSVAMCLFHAYTSATVPLQPMAQRSLHLAFAMTLIFLIAALNQKHGILRIVDYLLALAGMLFNIYIYFLWLDLIRRTVNPLPMDYVMGIVAIIVILIAAWKKCGIWLPLIAIAFIVYSFMGPMLPGILYYSGISFSRFLSKLYFGTLGIYGTCVGASATFAFMFILYAEFLLQLGGGDFLINISQAALGNVRGGPAKIAVVASSLFGTVSGSAVANVAGTGSITIPLMIKTGYQPEFAGAVEAAASTGGQLLPPVMGAAAFIMAEMLNTSYAKICRAAIIPALLYYIVMFVTVDMRAAKMGLKGIPKAELPDAKSVFAKGWYYLISLIVLVVLLIGLQWSAAKAAFWSILALMIVDGIAKYRIERRYDFKKLIEICESGCKGALMVASATACAGLIVGVFSATGLNLRICNMLVEASGGSLPVLLMLAMVGGIILGMGLPTTPVYIIMAIMVAPALVELGVPTLAAHLFVFYFGIMAPVTPPVGLAFYVAAGIANSDPMKTGFQSFKLSITGFLIPYVFVYNSALLAQGAMPAIIWSTFYCSVGSLALASGLEGYLWGDMKSVKRVIIVIAAIMTIIPETLSTVVGLSIILFVLSIQLLSKYKSSLILG